MVHEVPNGIYYGTLQHEQTVTIISVTVLSSVQVIVNFFLSILEHSTERTKIIVIFWLIRIEMVVAITSQLPKHRELTVNTVQVTYLKV